jgi:hypothetical protein
MADINLRLYAEKPQRRIAGTDFIAVTMYAAQDKSYRQYTLFDADGNRLGNVTSHGSRVGRPAGYHEGHGAHDYRKRTFRNLFEAASAFAAEKN